MEFIIELFVELFLELFAEGFFFFIAKAFVAFSDKYNSSKRFSLVFRTIFFLVLFASLIGLLIFALFAKRKLYPTVLIIYFILSTFMMIGRWLNITFQEGSLKLFFRINRSVLNYLLAISLIVVSCIWNRNDASNLNQSAIVVIICSSIGIIINIIGDIITSMRIKNKRMGEVE